MTLEETDFNHEQIQEELVAYLDGELSEEETARIESRLAQDAEYRQRLQSLQRTWDLLDHLPHTEVSEEFTQSTVEIIAVKAADEVAEHQRTSVRSRGLVWLVAAAIMLLAGGAAYSFTYSSLSSSNAKLVDDFEVIENVDVLRNIDSFEFLVSLRDDVLSAKAEAVDASREEVAASNREVMIRELSPDKKDELNRKRKRFESLDVDEQESLRQLYRRIDSDPDADQLVSVMLRYNEWLQTLAATERATLLDLEPDKKLARIEELQLQQVSEFTRSYVNIPIPLRDISRIRQWIQDFLYRHRDALVAAFPQDVRDELQEIENERDRMNLIRKSLASLDLKFFRGLAETDELDDLFGRTISREAMDLLSGQGKQFKPADLLARWLKEGISMPDFQQVDDAELNSFFNEVLDDTERSTLDEMSVDSRSRWLARSYMIYRFTGTKRPLSELTRWGEPSGRGGNRGGPGGRGGPGRGPGTGGGPRGPGGRGTGGGPGGGSNGGFGRQFESNGNGGGSGASRGGGRSGQDDQRDRNRRGNRPEQGEGQPGSSSNSPSITPTPSQETSNSRTESDPTNDSKDDN